MQQEELLKKAQELLAESELDFEQSDSKFLDLEAKREFKTLELAALEDRSVEIQDQCRELNAQCGKNLKEKLILEQRVNLLRDFEGFLGGILFKDSVEGAKYFTMTMSVFAFEHGLGEMSLEEQLLKSTDGFTISLEGEKYAFLKAFDGKYYFHPGALDENIFLCGKLLMAM